jgi:hypothetical protein
VPSEQLVHQTPEIRGQVPDHDKGQPGVAAEVVEEVLQGLEPSGGGTDSDHHELALGSHTHTAVALGSHIHQSSVKR